MSRIYHHAILIVCSGHARLLDETSTALLDEGGSIGQRRVAEACLLLATRSGAGMAKSGEPEKVDDACLIAAVQTKIGAPLNVQASINLDAPYYSNLAALQPLLAVHKHHNRRRLLDHGLADVPQSLAAVALSVVPDAASGLAGLTGLVAATTAPTSASTMAAATATTHGPVVIHGVVHLGLEVRVPASEFNVADGSEYTAVVSGMHSNGSSVPSLKTTDPICQLRFAQDDMRWWFSVERVTVWYYAQQQRSTRPPSPMAPDSEERQVQSPPEQTTKSPGSKERASPVRRRDPRRRL